MKNLLENKTALISGGARGQGAAEARLFAEEGARVIIGDVLDEEGKAVAESLGDKARYVHLDVSSETDWQNAVETAQKEFGKLDILINNAGVLHFAGIEDTSLEDYMRVIRINQVGTFLGMRTATPALKAAGGGSIVNISSNSAVTGLSHTSAYGASKWAIRGMTKIAAMELGRHGIRVNAVMPGGVNTPMIQDENGESETAFYEHLPLGRISQPEEIARIVCFVASDYCSYSTGSDFLADGGMTEGISFA